MRKPKMKLRFIIWNDGVARHMELTGKTHWLHSLPPTKTICTPRINLTFRMIIERI